uniref:Uncharacterized protein n=1 Tax=Octopus bimaculoides TaxID=37653 RepID=A0A0L8GKF2_OCTBM
MLAEILEDFLLILATKEFYFRSMESKDFSMLLYAFIFIYVEDCLTACQPFNIDL